MFIEALKISLIGVVVAIPIYAVLYIYVKRSRGRLHNLFKKKGIVFGRPLKTYVVAILPLFLCMLIFFVWGMIKVSSDTKTAEQAVTRQQTETTVATKDEVFATEIPVYNVSFPHGNLVFESTAEAVSFDNDDNIIKMADGFVLISGFSYDGDSEGAYDATIKHVSSHLPDDMKITSQVISKTADSYTFYTEDGKDSLTVPGYHYKGLLETEDTDEPKGIAGVCVIDEDNQMVYAITGIINDGSNDINSGTIDYLVSQSMETAVVKAKKD